MAVKHTPVPDQIKTHGDLAALAELWRELATAPPEDEEAKATLRALLSRSRRFSHAQRHGGDDCPKITIDLPLSVTGERFKINDTEYGPPAGSPDGTTVPVTLYRCEAQQLLWQVWMNQEVDRLRMKEGGRRAPVDIGAISGRAMRLPQD